MLDAYLNITDTIPFRDKKKIKKVEDEVAHIMSQKIAAGQLDPTIQETYIVCTRRGAANVTVVPKATFQ